MDIERYDEKCDLDAVRRIWIETGWHDPTDETSALSMDYLIKASSGWVAKMDGDAECLVLCSPGNMRYLDEEIPHSGVMAVTTSHIGRKQRLATRLTAHAVAEEAAGGAMLSGLGMFEQGYYDRLGFGSGPYDYMAAIDPRQLTVESPSRPARRVTKEDWAAVHAYRARRQKAHGQVTLDDPNVTRHNMTELKNGFGLGFCENGTLAHHLWCWARKPEHGPYEVAWMAYKTGGELLELLGVLKNLGDQVRLIHLVEPPGIQLQDLMRQPLQNRMITEDSRFETSSHALAHWQLRICDLTGCLERTRLRCSDLKFNLELTDPIAGCLPIDAPWKGIGGKYVVILAAASGAAAGHDKSLPTLKATVNAFTRLWLGVRPATGLAVTDSIDAPPELLEALDDALRLPTPRRDWMF